MLVLLGIGLLGLELLARVYWSIQGLSFFRCPRQIHLVYYRNIADFTPMLRPRGVENGAIEVLILGGSTVHSKLGPIPTLLLERLTEELGVRVNVTDLAQPAHTSLDSLYRYRLLRDFSFDLVLVYNSINELRANNCPPWMFRDDYSHYLWYREVNAVIDGWDRRVLALPITVRLMLIRAAESVGLAKVIPPTAISDPEWLAHGGEIKTAEILARNLREIATIANERGEQVVLMTYANHPVPDYSREKFDRLELDYKAHWFATEVWGWPPHVAAGLQAHNEAIRNHALGNGELFVDMAALIPGSGRYFNDICHLTNEGCALFVDNLMPVILPHLREVVERRHLHHPETGDMPDHAN